MRRQKRVNADRREHRQAWAARSPARARASYDVNDIVRLIVGPRGSVVTLNLAVVRDEDPAPGRDRLDP